MGRGTPPASPSTARVETEAASKDDGADRAWWRSFDEPVVLRVPRGLAVLIVAVAVGIVVLAYWVGNQRGIAAGKAIVEARLEGQTNLLRPRLAPDVPGGDGALDTPPQTTQTDLNQDPREAGLNYFVLVSYPRNAVGRDEALKLVGFLRQYGVEAAAVIGDNARFLSVVALRGFAPEELGAPAVGTYRQKLLSIGRDWKTAHDGRGNDLSDLYLDKYEGP